MRCLARGAWLVVAALAGPSPAQEAKYGKKDALVVGVNEYDHSSLSPLKYTENDAEELAKALRARGAGFASVRVLTATRGKKDPKDTPTAANIRAALGEILAEKNRNDTVLVALSGHGAQIEVKDPDDREKPRTYPYFCPADADFEKISFSTGESKRLVNLNDLFDRLGRCGAGNKLVLLDACRNDLKAASSKRNIDVEKVLIPRGVGALFSCSAGQFAHETGKLGKGHGVFFHYVLEGLKGKARNKKGVVTWGSLVEYVKEQVSDEVPGLIGGGAKQEPHSMGNLPGKVPPLVGISEAEADYRKGRELYHGVKGRENAAEAFKLFGQAAESGHLMARAYLAWMIGHGAGTKKDAPKGERLAKELLAELKQAAEEADPHAQDRLGYWHEHGFAAAKDPKQAAAWYRKAGEQGLEAAQVNLAYMLLNGAGIDKDEKQAAEWFRKAAEQGFERAQERLAWLYLDGKGVAKDEKLGADWMRKAAEQGAAWPQLHLGNLYREGRGVPKDHKQAVAWLRKAAEAKHVCAARNLADLLASAGPEKDEKAALNWYLKTEAIGGCGNCQRIASLALAKMYEQGRGTPKDDKQAYRWYLKAAERNDHEAITRLGLVHADGLLGIKKDDKLAVMWYRKAADQGNRDSQWYLAIHHAEGRGVAKDEKEAHKWVLKAAEQGQLDAQLSAAFRCANGIGTAKDDKEALKWYRKAADQGHANAMNWVGVFHAHARGTAKDDKEAAKWFRKAAEGGDAWGARNIGLSCQHGWGIAVDLKEAAKWFQKAGDLGYHHAWVWVGDLHAAGNLGPKDDKEAVAWYRKAADKGDAWGQMRLGVMYRDGRGIAKDEKLATEWLKKASGQKLKEADEELKKLGK